MPSSQQRVSRWHRVFISNNAKLWTNIVFVVATVKVAMTPLREISEFVWISWMAIAGGVELAKRVILGKLGVTTEEPEHHDHDEDHQQ